MCRDGRVPGRADRGRARRWPARAWARACRLRCPRGPVVPVVSLLYSWDAGLGRVLWERVVRDAMCTGAVESGVDQGQTGVARAPELCPARPSDQVGPPSRAPGALGQRDQHARVEVEGSEPAVRAWGMCRGPRGQDGDAAWLHVLRFRFSPLPRRHCTLAGWALLGPCTGRQGQGRVEGWQPAASPCRVALGAESAPTNLSSCDCLSLGL